MVNRSEFGSSFCQILAGQSQIYQAKDMCHSDKPLHTLSLSLLLQMAVRTFLCDIGCLRMTTSLPPPSSTSTINYSNESGYC